MQKGYAAFGCTAALDAAASIFSMKDPAGVTETPVKCSTKLSHAPKPLAQKCERLNHRVLTKGYAALGCMPCSAAFNMFSIKIPPASPML